MQMNITDERKEALLDCWDNETNEAETQEWRDNLTEEEAKLVAEWDMQYAKGMAGMCKQILELELQSSKSSHKDRDER